MRVRKATHDDVGAVHSIYEPIVRETAISFEEQVPDLAEIAERIEKSIVWFVCEDEGGVTGYGHAAPVRQPSAYRWSVEVTVYVHPHHRRRGVGHLLLQALITDLQKRGFVNVFAAIALPNDASVGLFESFNFRRVGSMNRVGYKLGEWRDVGWWQLRLDEPTVPPTEPRF